MENLNEIIQISPDVSTIFSDRMVSKVTEENHFPERI